MESWLHPYPVVNPKEICRDDFELLAMCHAKGEVATISCNGASPCPSTRVHEHAHGHRGMAPGRWDAPVPWPYWFATHRHPHLDPADEAALVLPPVPGT